MRTLPHTDAAGYYGSAAGGGEAIQPRNVIPPFIVCVTRPWSVVFCSFEAYPFSGQSESSLVCQSEEHLRDGYRDVFVEGGLYQAARFR